MQLISSTLFWSLSQTAVQQPAWTLSGTGRVGSRRDRLRGRKGWQEEEGGGSGGGGGRREGRGLDSYKSAGAFDRPVIYVTMALTMGSGPAVFH